MTNYDALSFIQEVYKQYTDPHSKNLGICEVVDDVSNLLNPPVEDFVDIVRFIEDNRPTDSRKHRYWWPLRDRKPRELYLIALEKYLTGLDPDATFVPKTLERTLFVQ